MDSRSGIENIDHFEKKRKEQQFQPNSSRNSLLAQSTGVTTQHNKTLHYTTQTNKRKIHFEEKLIALSVSAERTKTTAALPRMLFYSAHL